MNKNKQLGFGFIYFSFLASIPFHAFSAQSIWDDMRDHFKLHHDPKRLEVQRQIQWISTHPRYINYLTKHSTPFLYHVLYEVKKRHLPAELALIPMLESAYNPEALAGSGAAGLWQIMPNTGHLLGLKQDGWSDGRKGVGSSTYAALNHLERLYKKFYGNWIVSIAAYDCGEGSVMKAAKLSNQSLNQLDFWRLPLSQETQVYIPRLLALAEIIAHPDQYHIKLPQISNTPHVKEVNIENQIKLKHVAKLAGISLKHFKTLNPQFKKNTTAPDQTTKVLLPISKADDFIKKLALIPIDERMNLKSKKVYPGDNLEKIARKYNIDVDIMKEINALDSSSIKKHQFVLIPGLSGASSGKTLHTKSLNNRQYTIRKGDTLIHIATKHRMTLKKLMAINPKISARKLKPGQKINLS
jgi:membrane-bound lytic murein transglycosylase D